MTDRIYIDFSQGKLTHRDISYAELFLQIGNHIFRAEGVSRRNPVDKTDEELGALVAYGRALEVLARKVNRVAEGKKQHQDNQLKSKTKEEWEAILNSNKEVKKLKVKKKKKKS